MDFTSDTVLLSHAIDELYTMGKFSAFDTTSLFKEILDQSNIDEDDGSVVRAIMVYARSDVLPSEPDLEVTDALYSSRRFYYDCIYIHNKVTEVSGPIKPQHVYDRLTEMEDARSPGYYYELTRVLKKFSTAMGELLAHPAVRPIQDEVSSILAAPPSVRRMEELALQKQLQQEHQQLLQEQSSHETPSQQPLSTPKRQDHPATFKSPDTTGVGSPSQKSTIQFGTRPPPSVPASRPLGSPTPLRSPSAPPLSPQPALSSFVSSKERERLGQPRAKVERSNSGTSSGSGGGNGAGSGSGTGMDDAILI
ncbi:hypothetical protein BGZ98_009356 [Dissophora globulifera]|nr:hypothetical protein BGZ98_009356 [Dissophora globulifera]